MASWQATTAALCKVLFIMVFLSDANRPFSEALKLPLQIKLEIFRNCNQLAFRPMQGRRKLRNAGFDSEVERINLDSATRR